MKGISRFPGVIIRREKKSSLGVSFHTISSVHRVLAEAAAMGQVERFLHNSSARCEQSVMSK